MVSRVRRAAAVGNRKAAQGTAVIAAVAVTAALAGGTGQGNGNLPFNLGGSCPPGQHLADDLAGLPECAPGSPS